MTTVDNRPLSSFFIKKISEILRKIDKENFLERLTKTSKKWLNGGSKLQTLTRRCRMDCIIGMIIGNPLWQWGMWGKIGVIAILLYMGMFVVLFCALAWKVAQDKMNTVHGSSRGLVKGKYICRLRDYSDEPRVLIPAGMQDQVLKTMECELVVDIHCFEDETFTDQVSRNFFDSVEIESRVLVIWGMDKKTKKKEITDIIKEVPLDDC